MAAISANNAFYGAWIDHETGGFYGVPAAMGGLMGRPWQLVSLAKVLEITSTVRVPVLGGGGVFTFDDVARYLLAGCSLVPVRSGPLYALRPLRGTVPVRGARLGGGFCGGGPAAACLSRGLLRVRVVSRPLSQGRHPHGPRGDGGGGVERNGRDRRLVAFPVTASEGYTLPPALNRERCEVP